MSDKDKPQQIFHAALALDPDQRAAYLEVACRDNRQLRELVDSLLMANLEADQFMEGEMTCEQAGEADSDRLSQQIGPYKLLEKIGEGGFGVVYMAQQLDPIERRVALKIIKAGMDTKQVIARFEAERQALALMDHPHIAKILDAGETEAGRPYFVMELVRGVPVTEYCDQRGLTTEQRLKVFSHVCSAVQHAHQKGIVHRDIKPSNILVATNGDEAVPKVIDFGVAKATQGRLTDKTLFTQFKQFIGTPAYMSPEQAQMSAVDVDTRSDIYSLGVLLYELLTGKTPLDVQSLLSAGYDEICRRIREEEAVKPSKRLSSLQPDEITTLARQRKLAVSQFASSVRGELDWIVMKAVEKDRSRRYDSCGALAADVERYLSNEPVIAGPPSATYHFRKFLQRHRTATITSLTIAASLVLGTVLATYGMIRARSESQLKDLANEQLRQQIAATNTALATVEASRNAERAAKETVQQEKNRAMKTAYLADMRVAYQAMNEDNFRRATRILDETRSFPPDNDPRNWEWRALWKYCQGDQLRKFGVKGTWVESISISPDGQWVAAGGGGDLRIWNIATGELRKTIFEGVPTAGRAVFAPDGKTLYATEEVGTIRAWSVPEFLPTQRVMVHGEHELVDLTATPDGNWLVSLGRLGPGRSNTELDVVVWDTATGHPLKRKPVGNGYGIGSLGVSLDSSRLAVGTGPCKLLQLPSLDESQEFPRITGRGDIEISPDGEHVAIVQALDDPRVHIFKTSDGDMVDRLDGHTNGTKGVAYSPVGQILASASADQTIRLWETTAYKEIAKLRGHTNEVFSLKFTTDGKQLVSGGKGGEICVWRTEAIGETSDWPVFAGSVVWWGMWNRQHSQISFSPDSKKLACTRRRAEEFGGVEVRSPKDLRVLDVVDEPDGKKCGVRYSPTGDILAIGNDRGSLALFDADNHKVVTRIALRDDAKVFPNSFSKDGKYLLLAARSEKDTECVVLSVESRTPVARWIIDRDESCAISQDGQRVVTGHDDGIRFWDLSDTREPVKYLPSLGNTAVDVSPDGQFVASSTSAGLVQLINFASGEVTQEFVGHFQHVGGVKFSPDGKRLASAGNKTDGLILWDVETGREIMTFRAMGAGYSNRQVEWSPDGNSILLMGGHSDVSIWRVPSMQEIQRIEGRAG